MLSAPVVPGTRLEEWGVVHLGAEVGEHQRYAFTSRAALKRWAKGRREQWLMIPSGPNPVVLVLDEAWPLKYSGPVPVMRSAADGRRVLETLLRGEPTDAQMWFGHSHEWMLSMFLDEAMGDGEETLRKAAALHSRYGAYVALDSMNWTANGEATESGALMTRCPPTKFLVSSPTEIVGAGEGTTVMWRRVYAGPVKVVERMSWAFKSWTPQPTRRAVPMYLKVSA